MASSALRERVQELIEFALRRVLQAGLGVLDNEKHGQRQGCNQDLKGLFQAVGEPCDDADGDPAARQGYHRQTGDRAGCPLICRRQQPASE